MNRPTYQAQLHPESVATLWHEAGRGVFDRRANEALREHDITPPIEAETVITREVSQGVVRILRDGQQLFDIPLAEAP